ncbi:MAG: hypothetical protein FWG03_00195 [Clostridiales bacterium]|nr:hypothetical protein [Clostridiales bacterium]
MSGISKQRVVAALGLDYADRTPTFEWLIDKKVLEALEPGLDYVAFSDKYLDAICVELDYEKEDLGGGRTKNEWGIIQEDTGEEHAFPIDGAIHDRAEFEAYTPPRADKPGRYDRLKGMLSKYGEEKAVILHLNDVWSIPSRMMPFEDFLIMIMDDPQLVKDIVKMTVDAQIELAKGAREAGCEFVYTGDDVAYVSGPMISPAMFEEIFVPELKRVFQAYRDLGLYVMKHSDGYMMPLLDFYKDAGIHLFDPVDPIAGMDLSEVKEKYGRSFAIKGNVNCATTLVSGSEGDTAEEVKRCLKTGMPGGGYIISSSNTIHSSVKPENYKVMLETIFEYGKY